jgi:serine/threonine protein kinase
MSEIDPLQEFAAAVADGQPVEWASAKGGVESEDLDALAELQIIAAIARVHRESQEADSGDLALRLDEALPTKGGNETPLFTWGALRVFECLGQGSFGEVFRAWDMSLDREVALKLLRLEPSAALRNGDVITREGQLLARVSHPNVMVVHGASCIDGRVGIWGEFLRGRTLADIVQDDGPLSAQEASLFVDAVCRALTAVHRAGLLHRDIKAQNVMRESGGRIVLMDFGLGREADLPQGEHGLELAGTPLYLAPELFDREPASAQSDVYSVGVLLFHLVTGRFPIDGRSIPDIKQQHAAGRRVRLQDLRSDLPESFLQVVERALAPDRAVRFESAGALQAALSAAAPFAPAPVPAPVPVMAARSRGQRIGIVAVAALLATAGIVGLARWRSSPPREPIALTLSAPAGATFVEGSRNVPAVSPNGKNIAFLAKDDEGDMLWVRSLSDTQPRVIPNTKGAVRPFWSPDGQWIAYFANQGERRGLWRVDMSGARPEFLAPGTESRGGSWNHDDTLLLALDPHRGLQAMAARPGATPRWVTDVDVQAREAQHMWPQFLPDGQHFIFFVLSGDDDVEGVYLGTLDGGKAKLLVKTHTSALHVGSSLIYTNNGQLFTQPLDVEAGALTGTPHALDLDVDSTYDWLLVLSASETGTLVYRRPELRQLVWYDRVGRELGTLGKASRFRNPVISPDGVFVVAERYLLDLRELVAFDLVRGTEEVLPLPKRPSCPVWAPDGRLTFSAAPEIFSDIYATDVRSPRDWKRLVESPREKEPTGWSPDGRFLAYVVFETTEQGRQQDLWISSLADGRATPLVRSPAAEVNGQFSPGGRWIAYVSNEERQANVYVRRPGGTTRYKVSSGPALDPQWISDDVLLYLDPEGYMWQATIPADQPTQFVPERLFRSPVMTPGTSRNNYTLTPDKKRLLFNAWPRNAGPMTFSVVVNWPDLAQGKG